MERGAAVAVQERLTAALQHLAAGGDAALAARLAQAVLSSPPPALCPGPATTGAAATAASTRAGTPASAAAPPPRSSEAGGSTGGASASTPDATSGCMAEAESAAAADRFRASVDAALRSNGTGGLHSPGPACPSSTQCGSRADCPGSPGCFCGSQDPCSTAGSDNVLLGGCSEGSTSAELQEACAAPDQGTALPLAGGAAIDAAEPTGIGSGVPATGSPSRIEDCRTPTSPLVSSILTSGFRIGVVVVV